MRGKLVLAALCALLLGGCAAPITMRTEDLLTAPRLNQKQAEIYQALEATMDVSSIQYRYPQRGDNRSPFILYDLDGDDVEEAIVFFAYESDLENVRAVILYEDGQGGWHPPFNLTSQIGGMNHDQVDFIQFAHLLSADWECIVIGWQNTASGTSTLGVYSFVDGQMRTELTTGYHSYDIDNYVDNALQEVAVVALNEQSYTYHLNLYGRTRGGQLQSFGDLELSRDINSVLGLQRGRLWDEGYAVYVDELRTDTYAATEIVQVQADGLTMILGESVDEDNYRQTRRQPITLLCEDLTGDGVLAIPTVTDLPYVLESSELDPPPLIQYITIEPDESFTYAARAVRNEESGYLFFLPGHWVDESHTVQVTVLLRPESSEWRFYKVDPDFDTAELELLRIQVSSTRDYRDQFSDGFLLADRGVFQYYASIPRTVDEPLAVTEAQVREGFRLI